MAKIEDCPGFETFGADVKAARKAKRWARRTLAEMVSIDSRYLANCRTAFQCHFLGQQRITLKKHQNISQAAYLFKCIPDKTQFTGLFAQGYTVKLHHSQSLPC